MDNFKFNFHSRGQLESLNLDRIFLPLIFAIIARMLCGNHLNKAGVFVLLYRYPFSDRVTTTILFR